MRAALSALVLLSISTTYAAEAEPTPEATPSPAATDAEPAAELAELPPLNCKPAELHETVGSWSVDCVALWLDNLGFPELRTAFTGNSIDGVALKGLTLEKLADDYGVSDEEQRKKIYYNLKDVTRKDESSGNTNHYSQMLMWLLPFFALYKYMTIVYEKQIAKLYKKYNKWQEERNPPKPVEEVIYDDGTNDWTRGLNKDTGAGKDKKEGKKEKKEGKKEGTKEKRTKKVE